jgi:hypothetical protein
VPAAAHAEDFRVTNLANSGTGSLRDAISDANGSAGADRVVFKSRLTGTIGLSSGPLSISSPIDIVGPSARRLTVNAGGDSGVFFISTPVGTPVTISGLTITGGSVAGMDAGAGIANTGADLTVSHTTVRGNEAGRGAAVFTIGALEIESSTLSGNTSTGAGGAVYAFAYDVTAENSTVSGNSAGADGGAIYALHVPQLDLRSSTVARNSAGSDGGGLAVGGTTDVVTLDGSIVADNTSEDLHDGGAAVFHGAFSLIEDSGNALFTEDVGDIFGADPALEALQDNGGPTQTHALRKGSPARNRGATSGAPARDQRGAPRKGRADIGAYELVKCKGIEVDVVGTSGKDRLRGDGTVNAILGLGGADKLLGLQNRDALCGAAGKDKLVGGNGRDKLLGGGGKDLLKGGKAADRLNGGRGNDRCVPGGGPGNDKLKSC